MNLAYSKKENSIRKWKEKVPEFLKAYFNLPHSCDQSQHLLKVAVLGEAVESSRPSRILLDRGRMFDESDSSESDSRSLETKVG